MTRIAPRLLGFLLLSGLATSPALAQMYNAGDACPEPTPGRVFTQEGAAGPALVCNGTTLEVYESVLTGPLRKGIGTASPAATLHVNGEAIIGNTSLACSGTTEGAIRWNTTQKYLEVCNGTTYKQVYATDCDDLPDDFSFSDVTGAALSSTQTSAILQMTGIGCASVNVSISGGGSPQFRTCSDATCSSEIQTWTSSTTPISNNQYLQLRLTASGNSLTILSASLSVGTALDTWSVTTLDAGTFKRVFKTSTDQMGNFGGVTGADAICATRASAAGLGGTWMAWVATDATDDPESRFTHATIPYRRTDGALIANNWADLTDGTLSNGVTCDEFGACSAYQHSWTNVSTDGTATGSQNCTGWTVNSGQGMTGYVHHTAATWTNDSAYNCVSLLRLYCFQQ